MSGVHSLELRVANTAANRYYTNTPFLGDSLDKSGLTAAPKLIPLLNRPETIEPCHNIRRFP